MKKRDIIEGGHYTAKVSGKLVTVRVDRIYDSYNSLYNRYVTLYQVTNLKTGRKLQFRSAARFRRTTKKLS